jgi:hypothetical protein
MTKRFANLIAKAQRLESTIAAGIEGAARRVSGAPAREPLEIVHAVLDMLASEVQPAARGRQAFPFNQVRVAAVAATPRAKARLQVAFDGPPSLKERIVSHLEAAGCSVPALDVSVSIVGRPAPEWIEPDFNLTCARVATPAASVHTARVDLMVTHGVASQQTYTFTSPSIAIGRGDEVRDSRQRLLRTNDLVFAEGAGDVNDTVSRRHARIEHDQASGTFRVYDDGSAQGTSVVRKGHGIPVPRGTRGVRLQSGDEIVLGRARVRVEIRKDVPVLVLGS